MGSTFFASMYISLGPLMALFETNGEITTTLFFKDLITLLNDFMLMMDPILVMGLPGANIISFEFCIASFADSVIWAFSIFVVDYIRYWDASLVFYPKLL